MLDNLDRVKHTTVRCEMTLSPPDSVGALPEERTVTVPSLRLDAMVAAVYKISRSESQQLFMQKAYICKRQNDRQFIIYTERGRDNIGAAQGTVCVLRQNRRDKKNSVLKSPSEFFEIRTKNRTVKTCFLQSDIFLYCDYEFWSICSCKLGIRTFCVSKNTVSPSFKVQPSFPV